MGRKKIRVTTELVKKMNDTGIEELTRQECRALVRRGYLERVYMRNDAGTIRNGYRIVTTNMIKERRI